MPRWLRKPLAFVYGILNAGDERRQERVGPFGERAAR
jgi:hypothetical protein